MTMNAIPLITIDGEVTSLAAYEGQVVLVVNVASKCGNTPQYAKLEELQRSYGARGFTV
ncbi:MAG: glutathione peroxidase, partial [Microbacteriaceae bacterium]|nr:glutathione peroxidase [Microbacteriaceae bacterium]